MNTLSLKLVLTPVLIGAATLAGRRWGAGVSGWLVGLPFTSGPVLFFLALEHGGRFAALAAAGTMAGTLSQVAFCLAYSRLAARVSWPFALLAGCLAFAAVTFILRELILSLPATALIVLAGLAVALLLLPMGPDEASAPVIQPPAWDLPVRMVIATGFILLLTALASLLGPHLTGLLAPFPLYAGILTVFAHRLEGPAGAVDVLHGLLFGLFAFAGFFFTLAALIARTSIATSFAAAIAVALLTQACSLWMLRRRGPVPEGAPR